MSAKRDHSRRPLAALAGIVFVLAFGISAVRLLGASSEPPATAAAEAPVAPEGTVEDSTVAEGGSVQDRPVRAPVGERREYPGPLAEEPETVVSLTFDDGNVDQIIAANAMNRHGLPGTFYLASGLLDVPGHLTTDDVAWLDEGGHEIGRHTVSHADLASLPHREMTRQLCMNRDALMDLGYEVRSFAYPFASSNELAEHAAEECGFSSARGLGGVPMTPAPGQAAVAPMTPKNYYDLAALPQVETEWTFDDLTGAVERAEETGGWLIVTFHHVCESGCAISVTPETFEEFAAWLADRVDRGTVVRTVGDVIGGEPRPRVRGPVKDPLAPGVNGIVNASFEKAGDDGAPACWARGGFGENDAVLERTSESHAGEYGVSTVVDGHVDGDAKWLPRLDLGECAPQVEPGRQYSLQSWYASDTVTQFAVYLRSDTGHWKYWTSSPWFGSREDFTRAAWVTPEIPAGFSGLSFGLNLFSDGELVVDDAAMFVVDDGSTQTADR